MGQVMGVDVVGNDTGSDVWEGIEGEELMVSYGNQDMAMRVAFFSLSDVLASLVNVADYF